jgi:hypothetical protein
MARHGRAFPSVVLVGPAPWILAASAVPSGDLGTATATVAFTTVADLSTSITMAASASVAFTTAASLTTSITLVATATVAFTTAASLTTAIQMAAAATVAFTTAAALSTAISLAAAASVVFSSAADLTAGAGGGPSDPMDRAWQDDAPQWTGFLR